MLGRRAFVLLTAITCGAVASGFISTPVHAGDGVGGVVCTRSDTRPGCDVHVGLPHRPGSGEEGDNGGQDGDGKCHDPSGKEIPCERDGGWAGSDGCYYKPVDLSPELIGNLGGQPDGEGGWYQQVCYGPDGQANTGFGGPVWIAGAAPVVSPEVLARQARSKLELPEVVIELNPPGDQLRYLPVWMALDRRSWTTESATASVPGVSVTATARPVKVTWSMGDGSDVTCAGPGTPWTPGIDPEKPSPDCGHTYRAPGVFTVTATVEWEVTWAGAGQSGTVPGLTTTGQVQARVQESKTLINR
ncbi:PKD domain-containing protein [Actinoplanes siamensis]|uniref:PKD domain-containing protein n=1 Tax=Actinoplanes siamensis TaxID=1223317 RepID=UPI001944E2A3|nr:PKD domain-containing protein [Actinoplanes siamensis]